MGYRLSVIVPAYNSINTLPETLNCLLGQSLYEEMQIIVVDDGSNDRTAELVRNYQSNQKNILLIEKQNGGVSSARNAGIEAATGKYLVFCDADDLIGKDSAENLVNEMDKREADIGIFRVARFGFGGYEYNPIVEDLANCKAIPNSDKRLLWSFLVGNKCYRTELIKEGNIRFPETCYSEDGAFWMSAILNGNPKITGIRTASSLYRRSDPDIRKSVTQKITSRIVVGFTESMNIIDNLIERIPLSESFDFQKKSEYIQEFTYKKCYTILNEFYRQIWSSDNETMKQIEHIYNLLYETLDENHMQKLSDAFRELWPPVFSTDKLSGNPLINISVKKPSEIFLNSLYYQTMPGFYIVTKSKPEHIRFKNIGSVPKAGLTIRFRGKQPLDPRILRIIYLNKKSGKLAFLPGFVVKHISYMYIFMKDKKQKVLN